MLSIKEESIEYHFLSLSYVFTRDWTPVCRFIVVHWKHYTSALVKMQNNVNINLGFI